MLKHLHTALFAATTLFLPLAAQAQSSFDDIVQIDVMDGGTTANGTYHAAFRLTLSKGWKTYWRAPGDAGIPPQFTWRGSRNLGDINITWPTPDVFLQNGMQSIGYQHELVLPFEITPSKSGKPVRLKGKIDIGICKDVCVPSTLSFDHPVNPGAPRNPAIVAALAQRPYSASEAGVRATTCRLTPTETGLRLTAQITMPPAGGREVAVIEPGNAQIWASETQTTRSGNMLIASSDLEHVSDASFALDRSDVRITVLGKNHAVDILGCTPG